MAPLSKIFFSYDIIFSKCCKYSAAQFALPINDVLIDIPFKKAAASSV
jgi:hypothetical protein